MSSVSINQVAEQAGVSIATASRVISNSNYPVSNDARQRVLAAAAALNYTPNALARGMRRGRSNLIAIMVGDNSDPYFAEIMRGVEEVANQSGYLTIVCNTDRSPTKELNYLQTLRDYRTDGIIFAGSGLSEPGYTQQLEASVQSLQSQGAAVVTLSQHSLQVPSVQADNFEGARQMVAHLLKLGHQKIAFVTGPGNLNVANTRLQGYMAALAQAQLPIQSHLLINGDFSLAGGEQAAITLNSLSSSQRPSAIFGVNDETALGVLIGLRRLGWRIPEDVSLCGFGNLPLTEAVVPTLTTVEMNVRELGRRGVRKLLALLRHEPVEALEVLPTAIVERASTIALPSEK